MEVCHMSKKKCPACGHNMGVTHAQYTQCPTNITRNTPTSPVALEEDPIDIGGEISSSQVSSAFSRFQILSDDSNNDYTSFGENLVEADGQLALFPTVVVQKQYLTPEETFDLLSRPEDEDGLIGKEYIPVLMCSDGSFEASYGSDSFGDHIQSNIRNFLENNNIGYEPDPNGTQNYPDFDLGLGERIIPFEVKSYNTKANPGYDLGKFSSTNERLLENPLAVLEEKYLIVQYKKLPESSGGYKIVGMSLTPFWQISGPTNTKEENTPILNHHKVNKCLRPGNSVCEHHVDFIERYFETQIQNTLNEDEKEDLRERRKTIIKKLEEQKRIIDLCYLEIEKTDNLITYTF